MSASSLWKWVGDSAEVPGIGFFANGDTLTLDDQAAIDSLVEQGKIVPVGVISAPEVAAPVEEEAVAENAEDAAEEVSDDGERP